MGHEEIKPAEAKSKTVIDKAAEWIARNPYMVLGLAVIGVLGGMASIFALPYAAFPWRFGPRHDLSYCIAPIRTPIVQISKPSDVSISYKGVPVTGNVTAALVAIWNDGREPIRREEFLTPITLRLPDNVRILELSALKVSRSIVGFSMVHSNAPASSATLDWKILEHNDGVLLQIVYSGNTDTRISLDGTIVGQNAIHFQSVLPNKSAPRTVMLAVIFLGVWLFCVRTILRVFRVLKASKLVLRWIAAIVILFFGTGAFVLSLMFYMLMCRGWMDTTPFDF
jgi:hypothetical protein